MSKIESALERVYASFLPDLGDLEYLLRSSARQDMEFIFNFADKVRKESVGEGILLRGIIEFSNLCSKSCFYCGLNKDNQKLKRYSLNLDEILAAVSQIACRGIKTVVLQSAEDPGLDPLWLADVIKEIKKKFDPLAAEIPGFKPGDECASARGGSLINGSCLESEFYKNKKSAPDFSPGGSTLAITLSLGEKRYEDYRLWKEAGAERYLLKIETSDKKLYNSLHRGSSFENRLRCLRDLSSLGYEVGSGDIIGLDGQTIKSIAEDIIFFKQENFDMLGIGPFIPHPDTVLANEASGSAAMALKAVALTRIVTKNTHIPATTALGSLEEDFRIDALKAGANVLMPNFTPFPYRRLYELYPGRRFLDQPVGSSIGLGLELKLKDTDRFIDYSKGGRKYAEYTA